MEENMRIWDFELTNEDMDAISTMDIGYSEIIDHHSAGIAKWINEYEIHS